MVRCNILLKIKYQQMTYPWRIEDYHWFHMPPGGSDHDSDSDMLAVRCSGMEIYHTHTNHINRGSKIHGMKPGCLIHVHNIVQIPSWIRHNRLMTSICLGGAAPCEWPCNVWDESLPWNAILTSSWLAWIFLPKAGIKVEAFLWRVFLLTGRPFKHHSSTNWTNSSSTSWRMLVGPGWTCRIWWALREEDNSSLFLA